MRLAPTDMTMLKCQSFPSSNFFQQLTSEQDGGNETVSGSSSVVLRAIQRSSESVSETNSMESATSLFRSFFRDSVSEEEVSNSNVAIDNKIEQAMVSLIDSHFDSGESCSLECDLVKSHLMFAVREEVELLKEQIKDLLEKNQQLEYENGILRADATPETLAKLQASAPI